MRDIRALLEPVHSLDQTISIVETEIAAQDSEVDSLERWVKSLNFKRYRPMRGWPVELRNAHAKYKALGMAIRRPRVKFENAEREYLETRDRTPEDSLDLAHLAIEYGKVALETSEARLDVMIRWDRAFPDENAMKGHIQAASQFVACARKSLDSATKYRNEVYDLVRTGSPSVFE